MSIVQIDIWDVQSSMKTKGLVNRYFNIKSFIVMIQNTNMNLSVSQCKNCWKQGYTMGFCRIQGFKCVKYNSLHKLKHHYQFGWYCKANDKINPSCLETKKGDPCLYMFKYVNCKSEHQADLNMCLFWRHYFNKEQYVKKYQKLCKSKRQSICLVVNSNSS